MTAATRYLLSVGTLSSRYSSTKLTGTSPHLRAHAFNLCLRPTILRSCVLPQIVPPASVPARRPASTLCVHPPPRSVTTSVRAGYPLAVMVSIHRYTCSARPPSATQPHRRNFSFGVAASFIGKDRPYDPAVHVYHFDPQRQHDAPATPPPASARPNSGQDAFFVSRVGGTASVALGVADGVGGWMESGVDPADFSHGLCAYMARAASEVGSSAAPGVVSSARGLLQQGYEAVQRDGAIVAGGSTAVVGVLSPTGTLEVANLGDSGFVQLRPHAVHACSDPQTHGFNTPFQLSVVPPSLLARMAAFGGEQLSDVPADAEVTRHALRHGDVLVFASDGVWDNLFNQEILALVSHAMAAWGAWRPSRHDGGISVAPPYVLQQRMKMSSAGSGGGGSTLQSTVATMITAAAKAASVNAKVDGPFAKEVKRYYPHETWHGGKVDDICVVVAIVSEEPGSGKDGEDDALKSKL